MNQKLKVLTTVAALLAGLGTILSLPAAAQVAPAHAAGHTPDVSPEVLSAMQRDLRLSEEQARRRLAFEARAPALEASLRNELGTSFGGAWLNGDGSQLIVGVTDATSAELVRRAGAEPKQVTWNAEQLEEVKVALDRSAKWADKTIRAWYVDLTTNSVVVVSGDSAVSKSQAKSFITIIGAKGNAVRVEPSAEEFRTFDVLRGGDAYYPGNGLCSIGFPVNGGFVTAGHCGGVGTSTLGFNGAAQGTVQGSSFPGNDYAWVQVNSSWVSRPWVTNYAGGIASVQGSQEVPVGSSVCRSGATTGWRCGSIQAKNATVNYPQGLVYGLTRTNACAEPGDSGGSFISGTQAQGVTSGGSGNCTYGGTTFFQPINPILATYKLALSTAGFIQPGYNVLTALHSGQCLDVLGGNSTVDANVVQHPCHYGGNQQFKFTQVAPGYYQITAFHSGQCLDVLYGNSTVDSPVVQHPCYGGANQQFSLTPLNPPTNNIFRITARHSGQCLDVLFGNSTVDSKIVQHPCHDGANQQFLLK
ncbi:RICIN domain-containing protein [Cystobacter fuscus]|uniref:RICIN domain-containing protein n=1 Tax=Cystobacter fuscus TaxID=43 RepID=UPI002B2E2E38|nr:peptidase S1 [Cystobacter fuscus]